MTELLEETGEGEPDPGGASAEESSGRNADSAAPQPIVAEEDGVAEKGGTGENSESGPKSGPGGVTKRND